MTEKSIKIKQFSKKNTIPSELYRNIDALNAKKDISDLGNSEVNLHKINKEFSIKEKRENLSEENLVSLENIQFTGLQNKSHHILKDFILSIDKKEELVSKTIDILIKSGFRIIKSSHNGGKNKTFELLAIKKIQIDAHLTILICIPIIFCEVNFPLIVENDKVNIYIKNYNGSKILYLPTYLKENKIFLEQGLIQEIKPFFTQINKTYNITSSLIDKYDRLLLSNKSCSRNKLTYYKRVFYPILVVQKTVKTSQWRIPFAYQPISNLHIVSINKLDSTLSYLEKQTELFENLSTRKRSRKQSFSSFFKIILDLRNLSFPFLTFGIIFLLIILVYQNLIPFTMNVLPGTFLIYLTFMLFILIKYVKNWFFLRKILSIQPYTLKGSIKFSQKDIFMLQNEFSEEFINQFLFELGKKESKKDFDLFTCKNESDISYDRNNEGESSKTNTIAIKNSN